MVIPFTVVPGRLGAVVGASPHHDTPNLSNVVDSALRASLVSMYQVPVFAVLGAVALVIAVVGLVSPTRFGRGRLRGLFAVAELDLAGRIRNGRDQLVNLVFPDTDSKNAEWRDRVGIWYRFPPFILVVVGLGIASTVIWTIHSYDVSPRGFVDLSVYRLGVVQWWHGGDLYGVLPLTGVGLQLPFTYPPFAVTLLSALAVPSWTGAILGITVLSLVCLSVVVYLTVRTVWRKGGIRGALVASSLAVPLALFLEPVADTIWFGQVNLFLMALVALDCLVVKPKWPRGLLIGLAIAIKLTPVVFLLYFLLRKDYRTAITMAITAAAATAVGFVVTWSGSLTFWFGSTGGAHAVGDPSSLLNQSITGALARLDLTGNTRTLVWLVLVALAAVFGVIGIRRALRADSPVLAMVITAGLGLLASPISWGHHWVYVVPAIIAMVAKGIQERQRGWLFAAATAAAVYHVAPFLDMNLGSAWPPIAFLEANSFVLVDITLLVLFTGRTVRERLYLGYALLGRHLRRLPALPAELPALPTLPAKVVAEIVRTPNDA
jgi:alpha-1,2-mannosyltransferase